MKNDWNRIFGDLVHVNHFAGTTKHIEPRPVDSKVVPIRAKRENLHTWLGHGCANFEYWIRDDNVVICKKCEMEIGFFLPK